MLFFGRLRADLCTLLLYLIRSLVVNRSSIALGVGMLLSISIQLSAEVQLQRYVVVNGQSMPIKSNSQTDENKKEPEIEDEEDSFDDFFNVGASDADQVFRTPAEKHSALRIFMLRWMVWCAVKAENSYTAVCSWKDRFLAWVLHAKE